MSELSDKYYSREELLAMAIQKEIPDKYFDDFIAFVEKDLQQMTDDAELDDDEIGEAAIDFAKEYFDKFEIEIQKGHSKEWAHTYADSIEEHLHAFNEAYTTIKENDPVKAKQELEIHCRAINGDELYVRHFIFLMENGEALANPDKQSFSYSSIYKDQISSEKSEVFAHQYADLKSGEEYAEEYCFWYAKSFDECIQKGKSKKYAEFYADKMGDYYSDYYGRYRDDESMDEENNQFNVCRILGFMNGWEYTLEHKLEHSKIFIDYYDNIYINSYYADDRDYNISTDELDKDILKRALENYNSHMDK